MGVGDGKRAVTNHQIKVWVQKKRREAHECNSGSELAEPLPLHKAVGFARDQCLAALTAGIQRAHGLSADTTVLKSALYDVNESLERLQDCLPTFSAKEGGRELLLVLHENVEEMSMLHLKEVVKFLRDQIIILRKGLDDAEIQLNLAMGKLLRKDKVISYIRRTLYSEVVTLREQLYRRDHLGYFEHENFSIFDFVKLMDEGEQRAQEQAEQREMRRRLIEAFEEEKKRLLAAHSAEAEQLRTENDELLDRLATLEHKISSKVGETIQEHVEAAVKKEREDQEQKTKMLLVELGTLRGSLESQKSIMERQVAEYDDALRENDEEVDKLRAQLANLERNADTNSESAERIKLEKEQAERRLAELRAKLASVLEDQKEHLRGCNKVRQELEAELQRRGDECEQEQRAHSLTREQLAAEKDAIITLNYRLDDATARLIDSDKMLVTLKAQLDRAEGELQQANELGGELQRELKAAERDMVKTSETAAADALKRKMLERTVMTMGQGLRNKAQQSKAEVEKVAAQKEAELGEASTNQVLLVAENARHKQQVSQLSQELAALRDELGELRAAKQQWEKAEKARAASSARWGGRGAAALHRAQTASQSPKADGMQMLTLEVAKAELAELKEKLAAVCDDHARVEQELADRSKEATQLKVALQLERDKSAEQGRELRALSDRVSKLSKHKEEIGDIGNLRADRDRLAGEVRRQSQVAAAAEQRLSRAESTLELRVGAIRSALEQDNQRERRHQRETVDLQLDAMREAHEAELDGLREELRYTQDNLERELDDARQDLDETRQAYDALLQHSTTLMQQLAAAQASPQQQQGRPAERAESDGAGGPPLSPAETSPGSGAGMRSPGSSRGDRPGASARKSMTQVQKEIGRLALSPLSQLGLSPASRHSPPPVDLGVRAPPQLLMSMIPPHLLAQLHPRGKKPARRTVATQTERRTAVAFDTTAGDTPPTAAPPAADKPPVRRPVVLTDSASLAPRSPPSEPPELGGAPPSPSAAPQPPPAGAMSPPEARGGGEALILPREPFPRPAVAGGQPPPPELLPVTAPWRHPGHLIAGIAGLSGLIEAAGSAEGAPTNCYSLNRNRHIAAADPKGPWVARSLVSPLPVPLQLAADPDTPAAEGIPEADTAAPSAYPLPAYYDTGFEPAPLAELQGGRRPPQKALDLPPRHMGVPRPAAAAEPAAEVSPRRSAPRQMKAGRPEPRPESPRPGAAAGMLVAGGALTRASRPGSGSRPQRRPQSAAASWPLTRNRGLPDVGATKWAPHVVLPPPGAVLDGGALRRVAVGADCAAEAAERPRDRPAPWVDTRDHLRQATEAAKVLDTISGRGQHRAHLKQAVASLSPRNADRIGARPPSKAAAPWVALVASGLKEHRMERGRPPRRERAPPPPSPLTPLSDPAF